MAAEARVLRHLVSVVDVLRQLHLPLHVQQLRVRRVSVDDDSQQTVHNDVSVSASGYRISIVRAWYQL